MKKITLLFVVAIVCIVSTAFLVAQGNLINSVSQSAHRHLLSLSKGMRGGAYEGR